MATPKLKLPSRPLEIVKPDYNLKYLRFLVYGETGVGKTVLCASAADVPDLAPILFCDADLGTMSISDRDIDVVPIRSMNDLMNVNRYVRGHEGEYKTVVIDGLTALYYLMIRKRLREPDRTKNEDPYVPSQRDYLHGTFRLRVVIQMFKTAPINVLCTALVDVRTDEFTDIRRVRPALSNKLAQEVGAEFDVVGHLSVKVQFQTLTRVLQLEPYGGRGAKNRSVYKLPAVLSNPTMTTIYNGCILGILPKPEKTPAKLTK